MCKVTEKVNKFPSIHSDASTGRHDTRRPEIIYLKCLHIICSSLIENIVSIYCKDKLLKTPFLSPGTKLIFAR